MFTEQELGLYPGLENPPQYVEINCPRLPFTRKGFEKSPETESTRGRIVKGEWYCVWVPGHKTPYGVDAYYPMKILEIESDGFVAWCPLTGVVKAEYHTAYRLKIEATRLPKATKYPKLTMVS